MFCEIRLPAKWSTWARHATIVSSQRVFALFGLPIRTGFQHLMMLDVFKDFPELKNHHSHGRRWRCLTLGERFRGMAADKVLIWPERVLNNVYFWYLCLCNQRWYWFCYWILFQRKPLVSVWNDWWPYVVIDPETGPLFWWYAKRYIDNNTVFECWAKTSHLWRQRASCLFTIESNKALDLKGKERYQCEIM